MSRPSANEQKTVISDIFSIPDGVEDMSYVQSDTPPSVIAEDFEEYYDDFSSEEVGSSQSALDTPEIIGVVDPQTLRMSSSGAEVVDIILDVGDVIGAGNYEVRVTKI